MFYKPPAYFSFPIKRIKYASSFHLFPKKILCFFPSSFRKLCIISGNSYVISSYLSWSWRTCFFWFDEAWLRVSNWYTSIRKFRYYRSFIRFPRTATFWKWSFPRQRGKRGWWGRRIYICRIQFSLNYFSSEIYKCL